MITKSFSPAEYLALSRDRTRKLHAAEDDAVLATRLCTSTDSDGDWVPDVTDRCPNTPDLAATDDEGCPLASLPAGGPVSGFATKTVFPSPLRLEQPTSTKVSRNEDLALVWSGGAPSVELFLWVASVTESNSTSVQCYFESEPGRGTVPRAFLSSLESGDDFLLYTFRRDRVQHGEYSTTIQVGTEVLSPNGLPRLEIE